MTLCTATRGAHGCAAEISLDFFGAFGDIRRFKSVCGELCPGAKAARFFVVRRAIA
jgi:L-cysteine desulfidase